MNESREREIYETYMAQNLWDLTRAVYGLGGGKYDMPQYVDLIRPEIGRKAQTAQEIKDHVVSRLLEA